MVSNFPSWMTRAGWGSPRARAPRFEKANFVRYFSINPKKMLLGPENFSLGGGPYGTLPHFWDNAFCRYAFGKLPR